MSRGPDWQQKAYSIASGTSLAGKQLRFFHARIFSASPQMNGGPKIYGAEAFLPPRRGRYLAGVCERLASM